MRKLVIILLGCMLASSCAAAEPEEQETSPRPGVSERAVRQPRLSSEEFYAKQEAFQASFERADAETVRLSPGDFGDLPPIVVQELDSRGCTIPQAWTEKGRGNVIRGPFTAPEAMDLAVLCSRDRVSSILVFRNSSAEDVDELASEPDNNYLQVVGHEQIGYSRALSPANPRRILRFNSGDSSINVRLDHSGIEDHFLEKASTIWYWHEGKWLEFLGTD